ncbi:MAG TPA: hypothetical protein VEL81_05275 [Thermoplasmata archaeon]|nr:hypothetical protein [Thermoplasmata archaeon]
MSLTWAAVRDAATTPATPSEISAFARSSPYSGASDRGAYDPAEKSALSFV